MSTFVSFDASAVDERRADADEDDEVGRADRHRARAPASPLLRLFAATRGRAVLLDALPPRASQAPARHVQLRADAAFRMLSRCRGRQSGRRQEAGMQPGPDAYVRRIMVNLANDWWPLTLLRRREPGKGAARRPRSRRSRSGR